MMKNLQRLLVFLLILALGFSLTACQQANPESSSQLDTGGSSSTDGSSSSQPDQSTAETAPPAANFLVEPKARLQDAATKSWQTDLTVDTGDIVEIQVQYANYDEVAHHHVAFIVALPDGLEFVTGSTKLYNIAYPDGLVIEEDYLVTEGILIGSYAGYTITQDSTPANGDASASSSGASSSSPSASTSSSKVSAGDSSASTSNPDSSSSSNDPNTASPTNGTPRYTNAYLRFAVKVTTPTAEVSNLPITIKCDATRQDSDTSTMTCNFFYLNLKSSTSV